MNEREPKVIGCNCDFSGGTRGMDRCHECNGTGSRFFVVVDGKAFFFPNTHKGYIEAIAKLGREA